MPSQFCQISIFNGRSSTVPGDARISGVPALVCRISAAAASEIRASPPPRCGQSLRTVSHRWTPKSLIVAELFVPLNVWKEL
jgi:hypothetical protein